jgi:hypothetical protein
LTLLLVLLFIPAIRLHRFYLESREIVLWMVSFFMISLLLNAQALQSVKHVVQPASMELADIVWLVTIFQVGYALLVL